MPAVPSWVIEPIWAEFAARIPPVIDMYPLGCHRPRIPDRVVFDKLVEALVFGAAYVKIADETCSATSIRSRRDEWIEAGIFTDLEQECLEAYDRMIGLDLENLSVDGCIVKAPCGGDAAGRSPMDRGKQRTKRSVLVDGNGIPLGCVVADANCHDSPLLAPTLDGLSRFAVRLPERITLHLDAGYDSGKTRDLLDTLGLDSEISNKGVPLQVGKRWPVERTNSWHTRGFCKLQICTERRGRVIDAFIAPRRRDHHRPTPHPRSLDRLPLERSPTQTTMTYPRDL